MPANTGSKLAEIQESDGWNMANAIDTAMARELAELQLELKKRQWLSALRWRQRMNTWLSSSGIGASALAQ